MKIHIVKQGDTMFELAKKYGVDLKSLIGANPQIVNPDKLEVGTKVKIPTKAMPIQIPTKPFGMLTPKKQPSPAAQLPPLQTGPSKDLFDQFHVPAIEVGSFYDMPPLVPSSSSPWSYGHPLPFSPSGIPGYGLPDGQAQTQQAPGFQPDGWPGSTFSPGAGQFPQFPGMGEYPQAPGMSPLPQQPGMGMLPQFPGAGQFPQIPGMGMFPGMAPPGEMPPSGQFPQIPGMGPFPGMFQSGGMPPMGQMPPTGQNPQLSGGSEPDGMGQYPQAPVMHDPLAWPSIPPTGPGTQQQLPFPYAGSPLTGFPQVGMPGGEPMTGGMQQHLPFPYTGPQGLPYMGYPHTGAPYTGMPGFPPTGAPYTGMPSAPPFIRPDGTYAPQYFNQGSPFAMTEGFVPWSGGWPMYPPAGGYYPKEDCGCGGSKRNGHPFAAPYADPNFRASTSGEGNNATNSVAEKPASVTGAVRKGGKLVGHKVKKRSKRSNATAGKKPWLSH